MAFSYAAGADVFTGLANAYASWAAGSAQRTVSKAQADAQNTIRKAQNQQRAAGLSLAATMRDLSYHATLTNAGEQYNSSSELLARTSEAWARGNFEQGLRNIEQLGAYSARASAAGVGGSSVQIISQTLQLQQARLAERSASKQEDQTYELLKARAGLMPAAISRLDVSPLSPNLDYSMNLTPAGTAGDGLASALIKGLLTKRESLQVAINSLDENKPLPTTGDFSRMDRAMTPITID